MTVNKKRRLRRKKEDFKEMTSSSDDQQASGSQERVNYSRDQKLYERVKKSREFTVRAVSVDGPDDGKRSMRLDAFKKLCDRLERKAFSTHETNSADDADIPLDQSEQDQLDTDNTIQYLEGVLAANDPLTVGSFHGLSQPIFVNSDVDSGTLDNKLKKADEGNKAVRRTDTELSSPSLRIPDANPPQSHERSSLDANNETPPQTPSNRFSGDSAKQVEKSLNRRKSNLSKLSASNTSASPHSSYFDLSQVDPILRSDRRR